MASPDPNSPGQHSGRPELLQRLQAGESDFIDIGTGVGGSIGFVRKSFGAGPGLGIDIDPDKLAKARAAGHEVIEGDLADLELPAGCVSFVSAMDVLEHLPDLDATRRVLGAAAKVARDAIFIRHPSFEDIESLAALGSS